LVKVGYRVSGKLDHGADAGRGFPTNAILVVVALGLVLLTILFGASSDNLQPALIVVVLVLIGGSIIGAASSFGR
jgi:hypothetical protein